jgi:hypothetical protein
LKERRMLDEILEILALAGKRIVITLEEMIWVG